MSADGANQVIKGSQVFKIITKLVLVSLFVFTAGEALAQDEPEQPASKDNVQNYDFTGDDIDGDVIKPDGEIIDASKSIKFTSPIRVREDFIREILKSAEDL